MNMKEAAQDDGRGKTTWVKTEKSSDGSSKTTVSRGMVRKAIHLAIHSSCVAAFTKKWGGVLALLVFASLLISESANALQIGDRVKANAVVNVRSTAAGSVVAGTQASGNLGSIIGGPQTASLSGTSYIWWNVNWDVAPDGWVASIGLDLVTPSTTTTTKAPTSTTISSTTSTTKATTSSTTTTTTQPSNSTSFIWPVDNPNPISNGYATKNAIGNNKYHTGLDITSSSGRLIVRAVAAGTVRIIPKGTYANQNHCMGNVVVIDHNNGTFSLYAHLASFAVTNGQAITAGTQIGVMGNTGTGPSPSCVPVDNSNTHLHFELRYWDALGNLSDDSGPIWGYAEGHPNLYGYINPWPYLEFNISSVKPVAITSTTNQIVRTGPSTSYTNAVASVTTGQKFAAFAAYKDWYQVSLPSIDGPAGGWIQGTQDSTSALLEIHDPQRGITGVSVRDVASTTGTKLAYAWDKQWLVDIASSASGNGCTSQWFQTPVASNTGATTGWFCGQYAVRHGAVTSDSTAPTTTTAAVVTTTTRRPATTTIVPITTTTVAGTTTTSTVASATTTTLASGKLNFVPGWNLVGNSSSTPINVPTAFGNASNSKTVWKWVAATAKWAFYAPSLVGQALSEYALSKGYDVLSTISGGEGFWVNANAAFSVPLAGSAVNTSSFKDSLLPPNPLPTGWSLIAVGDNPTPRGFANAIAANPPTAGAVAASSGLTTLWAWDSARSGWYFYAPSLDNTGGLSAYATSKGYLDFTSPGKTLGSGVGFWVNKP